MRYLLDTCTCIYLIKAHPPQVGQRFGQQRLEDVCLSSVVTGELYFGAAKSGSARNREALERFLDAFQIVPFDRAASSWAGELRAHLAAQGTPIGPYDTMIAAHALALDCTLITNNEREFRRVPGLKVENWLV